jgi:ethanolamine transporter EutH
MTDLILTIVLVGTAVAYTLGILDVISFGVIDASTINTWFSLPLNVLGLWLIQPQLSSQTFVTAPAATFISLALLKLMNKQTKVQYQRLPRL